jgi:hypothetical protein
MLYDIINLTLEGLALSKERKGGLTLNNSDLILHLIEQLIAEKEKNLQLQQQQEKNQQMQNNNAKTIM